jgi:hypothetical protein
VPPILRASRAEWHVVELDRCATDMLEAVRVSHAYLAGLAWPAAPEPGAATAASTGPAL